MYSKTDRYFVEIISKLEKLNLHKTNRMEELCRDEQGNFRDTLSILKELDKIEREA